MSSKKFGLKLNLNSKKEKIDEIYLYHFEKELYFSCTLYYDLFFKTHKILKPIPEGINIFYISEFIFFKILGEFRYTGNDNLKVFLRENELEELII